MTGFLIQTTGLFVLVVFLLAAFYQIDRYIHPEYYEDYEEDNDDDR